MLLLLLYVLLIHLVPLQLASSIGEVLGQGLKESKLNHEMTACGGGGEHSTGGGGGGGIATEKEWTWEAREYSLKVDGKDYVFKEYMPDVFCHMRTRLQIDNGRFYASLTGTALKDWENPANSGSAFLTSADGHFMLKSLSMEDKEPKIFEKQLPKYMHYMAGHLNSFITRYLGYYSVQKADSKEPSWFFICMPNILSYPTAINSGDNPLKVDYRFDLKGISFNRKVSKEELAKAEPTLRDWDFNGRENGEALFRDAILLEEGVYREIAEIVRQDAEFLGRVMAVFDYSMFIGIHFNDSQEEEEAKNIKHFRRLANGGIPASCVGCRMPHEKLAKAGPEEEEGEGNGANASAKRRSISLYVGIIDLLRDWTLRPIVTMMKRCYFTKECPKVDQVLMHPTKYAARFKCFFNRDVFHLEDDKAMSAPGRDYCSDFNNIDWSLDVNWADEDDRRTFDGTIDRSGRIPRVIRIRENSLNGHFNPEFEPFFNANLDPGQRCSCGRSIRREMKRFFQPATFVPSLKHLDGRIFGIRYDKLWHAEMIIKKSGHKIAYKCVALKTNSTGKSAKKEEVDVDSLGHGYFMENGHNFVYYSILELDNASANWKENSAKEKGKNGIKRGGGGRMVGIGKMGTCNLFTHLYTYLAWIWNGYVFSSNIIPIYS